MILPNSQLLGLLFPIDYYHGEMTSTITLGNQVLTRTLMPMYEINNALCIGAEGESIEQRHRMLHVPLAQYDVNPEYRARALFERAISLCDAAILNPPNLVRPSYVEVGLRGMLALNDLQNCDPIILFDSQGLPGFQPPESCRAFDVPLPGRSFDDSTEMTLCDWVIGVRAPAGIMVHHPSGIGMFILPENVVAVRVDLPSRESPHA